MDGQFNPLEHLLGIDPNLMAAGAGTLLPGQTDDLLMAMPTALGGFDMRELMSLMNPPEVQNNGIQTPSANTNPVARPAGRMNQAPAGRPQQATGRSDLQQRQRDAQKMEIRRGQLERQAKKKKGY